MLFLTFPHVFAEVCTEVDLRQTDYFNNIGIYNQADTGICYSMADANLINYWQLSNGMESKIHPFELIALNPLRSIEGGNLAVANVIKRRKMCDHQKIKQFFKMHTKTGNMVDFLRFFLRSEGFSRKEHKALKILVRQELEKRYEFHGVPPHARSSGSLGRDQIIARERALGNTQQMYKGIAIRFLKSLREQKECRECLDGNPTKNEATLASIGKWIYQEATVPEQNHIEVIEEIYNSLCQDNFTALNLPSLIGFTVNKNSREALNTSIASILNELDKSFDQVLPQPFKLGFCANILSDPHYKLYSTLLGKVQRRRDCGGHAVVLIARRPSRLRPGQCEYLIRNSWGLANRRQYHASYELESAGVWITKSQLQNSLLDGYRLVD